ncbi:hypothetical protein GCM10027059_13990 [Myceligenerans halotolerans]
MPFTATLTQTEPDAVITLVGELDSSTAATFRSTIEDAVATEPQRLLLEMSGLTYLSSAGLRCLVFARQKMGSDVDIVLIATRPAVRETIDMTGFQYSVQFTDQAEV